MRDVTHTSAVELPPAIPQIRAFGVTPDDALAEALYELEAHRLGARNIRRIEITPDVDSVDTNAGPVASLSFNCRIEVQ